MKHCSMSFTSDIVAAILRACGMKPFWKFNIFLCALFIQLLVEFLAVIYIEEYFEYVRVMPQGKVLQTIW